MLVFSNSMIDQYKKVLAYDQWSLDLLLKDIEVLPTPDPTALGRLSHILFAEDVWLTRILGEDLSRFLTPWPARSTAECGEKLEEMGKKWSAYLNGLKEEDLSKIISYKNTKGQAFQLPVGAIVTHVFDHSTYHRGQIATAIKKAGGEPHSPGFNAFVFENQK
jgi:uncharacterized damage-inducible protein DinB